MFSVTSRVGKIKQPYGGYLPQSSFNKIKLDDGKTLYPEENIHASLVGLAVDYLTRFCVNGHKKEAFEISLRGAERVKEKANAQKLLKRVKIGLDDASIINACKLVGYDVCFRNPIYILQFEGVDHIQPDSHTIENIRIMVERSKEFIVKYGPILKYGITFEGGYTKLVSTGDADFITNDTLWDFKVTKRNVTSKNTLQILMYYLMLQHSVHQEYKKINHVGFFNPRLNLVLTKDINTVDEETLHIVEKEIIGYDGQDEIILEEIRQERIEMRKALGLDCNNLFPNLRK